MWHGGYFVSASMSYKSMRCASRIPEDMYTANLMHIFAGVLCMNAVSFCRLTNRIEQLCGHKGLHLLTQISSISHEFRACINNSIHITRFCIIGPFWMESNNGAELDNEKKTLPLMRRRSNYSDTRVGLTQPEGNKSLELKDRKIAGIDVPAHH